MLRDDTSVGRAGAAVAVLRDDSAVGPVGAAVAAPCDDAVVELAGATVAVPRHDASVGLAGAAALSGASLAGLKVYMADLTATAPAHRARLLGTQ